MPPVLRRVYFLLSLEPAFGRFLWDKVAIQQPGVQQRPIRSHDGIPPHAHGFGDLPAGWSLWLELILANTMRVNDKFTERNVGCFQSVEHPHAAFSTKCLVFLRCLYYYTHVGLFSTLKSLSG